MSVSTCTIFLATATFLLIPSLLTAQTTSWTGGGDNSTFNQDSNWTNDAPDNATDATIDPAGVLSLQLNAAIDVRDFTVLGQMDGETAPHLTINLNSHTLNGYSGTLFFHNTAGVARSLTFLNGTYRAGRMMFSDNFISENPQPTILTVGSNAFFHLEHNSTTNSQIGRYGAQLRIENGGHFRFTGDGTGDGSRLFLGSRAKQEPAPIISVSGTGSQFTSDDGTVLYIGGLTGQGAAVADAEFRVENGATATLNYVNITRGGLSSGSVNPGGSGHLKVDGTGSTLSAERMFVGGGQRFGSASNTATASGAPGYITLTNQSASTFNLLQAFEGTVSIDNALATVTGNAIFEENSALALHLYNPQQDPLLVVSHSVTSDALLAVNNAQLLVTLDHDFSALVGETITLIRYDIFNPENGHFNGLADGATITVGDYSFVIDYEWIDGGNNYIALTVIPEPITSSIILALLVAGLVAVRRMRTSRR